MTSFLGNAPVANNLYGIANGTNTTVPFMTIQMSRNPTTSDINYPVTQRWINTSNSDEWFLKSFSSVSGTTTANWILLNQSAAIESIMIPGPVDITPDINGEVTFQSSLGSIAITSPSASKINFELLNYAVSTWTPTLDGASPGVTTYSIQSGYYVQLANLIWAEFVVTASAATGTGILVIGGLPVNINPQAHGFVYGSVISQSAAGLTWPASTTSLSLVGLPGGKTMQIYCSGSGTVGDFLHIANTSLNIQGTIVYQV